VSGGEPMVYLDVDGWHRLGHEPVPVGPLAVLNDLEDEFDPVLYEPKAPAGLVAPGTDLEEHRIEQTTSAKADVGRPGGVIIDDPYNRCPYNR